MKTLLLTLLLLFSACGLGEEEKKNDGISISGDGNTVITAGDVQIACGALLHRSAGEFDCDDDEVKVNCDQCFDDAFREQLDVNVGTCIKDLQELGYCE